MAAKTLDCRQNILDFVAALSTTAHLHDVQFYTASQNQTESSDSDLDSSDVEHGKVLFKGHRLILALQSPIFEKQLFGNFAESQELRVFVDPELAADHIVFKQFMHFFYTGRLVIDEKTVVPFMKLANFYDVETLRRECEIYLAENITIDTASALLMEAVDLDKDLLFNRCMEVIRNNFEAVVQTRGFRQCITPEILEIILSNDQLMISEVDLFRHLCRWLRMRRSPPDERLTVLQHVRYVYIAPEDLVNVVLPAQEVPEDWVFTALAWPLADQNVRQRYLKLPFNNRRRLTEIALPAVHWNTDLMGKHIEHDDARLLCVHGSFNLALADQMVLEGRTKWTLRILNVPRKSHWELGIGFAKSSINLYHYLSAGEDGWAYYTTGGLGRSYIAHNKASCSNTYGVDYGEGDVVTVSFSRKGEVTFYVNGESQGIAFRNVPLDVYPAVHLRNGAAVELVEK